MAANGSFAKAKESGHWRLEGKEYVVKDGDIISVRHS
jgi:ribosome-binding ATPase YchF (GTP1/OBG family)